MLNGWQNRMNITLFCGMQGKKKL